MKKGFTLVEVLAVIAILGLVVAISIPKVISTMNDSNKKAFKVDAQLVLKTIDLKLAQGLDYDITTLDETTIKSVFGINNKNYKALTISYLDDLPYLSIEGKNAWEGLVAYGTQDEMTVSDADYVDSVAPVVSLVGSSQVYLEVGAIYYEVGASAIDNHDGDITEKITMQGNLVNTSVPGTYVLNYAVQDHAGNTSSINRTVTVFNNEAPTVVFGMNGNSTYAKTRSTSVLVSDNVAVVASSLKYQWTTSTTTPTEASFSTTFTNGDTISSPVGVTGGYYLWILAKDPNGNTMIEKSNVFNLDNTAPVITITGSSTISAPSGSIYTDLGATATDGIDGSRTSYITTVSTVDTSATGTYTVRYNVSDSSGNSATEQVRTVNVTVGRVEVLIVAGGGGGAGGLGGGGGGGAVIKMPSVSVASGTSYDVVVGAGGAGSYYGNRSANGGNSSAFGAVAYGGGGSSVHDSSDGSAGGCGGGAASNNSRINQGGASTGGTLGGNTGTIHGNRGGNMTSARTADPTRAAGGGGAGAIGVDTNSNVAGNTGQTGAGAGGAGIESDILGTNYYWGGGGGGGAYNSQIGGYGGLGGGGGGGGIGGAGLGGGSALNSGGNGGNPAGNGGANTGGGGGGSYWQTTTGGNGGSGIVVIRYYGSQKATGGTVTTWNGYTIHTFTSSGTFVVSTS